MAYSEDYIIQYIRGDLSERQNRELEAAMEIDPALRDEVAFHKNLMKGLEYKVKQDLKAKLQEYEAAVNDKAVAKKQQESALVQWLKPYWKVAALVLFVMGVGAGASLYWFMPPSGSAIASNHFEAYPNHITQQYRGSQDSDKQNPVLVKAMNAYSSGNYPKAIDKLKLVLENQNGGALTHFYLGNAYMAQNKANAAIHHFEQARKAPLPDRYQKPNLWFLSLANLSGNQTKKANQLLDTLCARSDGFYHRKAKTLQKELGSSSS